MKTIGYVLADFPVLSETFVGDEIRAMQARGHTVIPIVMHRRLGTAQAADVKLADTAEYLSNATVADALGAMARPSLSFMQSIAFVRRQTRLSRRSLMWNSLKIAKIARNAGCSHLHAHFAGGATAHAITAARWIGAKVSFICHGHDIYAEPEDLPLKLRAADLVVSTCEDMTADLLSFAPDAFVTTIPCGIDAQQFVNADPHGCNGRLLFVGRLVGQKGIGDLIAALASTDSSVAIDIVGDGPLRDELLAQVAKSGLGAERIRFLGLQSREWIAQNAPRYIGLVAPFKQAADGSRDTGPIVVKEAMAMQLPVIATRFMGLKQIVTPQTGLQIDVGDVPALAKAMTALVGMDSAKRLAMGVAARSRLESMFTIDRQALTFSRLLEAA